MKSIIAVIALGLFMTTLVIRPSEKQKQVEPAPTIAQCQADQKLLFPKLGYGSPATSPDITFPDLAHWMAEMRACEKVDPANQRVYYDTGTDASDIIEMRLSDYLDRHALWPQFLKEDAAGKR